MEVDWLNIQPLTGGTGQTEIYGYVTPNERIGSVRTATVRFTNEEGLTADLNLSQGSDTGDIRFVVTPTYLYVQGGGDTFNVNVLTNSFWKVTNYESGLTITSDNQTGYGDALLTVVFPPNPDTNNWSGYDYNGRPFYGRSGYITIQSPMGVQQVYWEQAAYEAITVTPNRLVFPQTGGTMSVTVKSVADWTVTSYDSDNVTLSALSGHSGETVVQVTKAGLTSGQVEYYVTKPSVIEFNDGSNVALLNVDSTLDDYFINDDWITVTYNVPSANTVVNLFEHLTTEKITPEVVFQDDEHSNMYTENTRIGTTTEDTRTLKQYLTVYSTPGLHTIKMRFNKEGVIIPKYGFLGPAGFSPRGEKCFEKIVIGNLLSGDIEACVAINSGFKEVILGTGQITMVGEFAFLGCGSANKDFVLGNNVTGLMYNPFHNFKARKFVYNQDRLGGNTRSITSSVLAQSKSSSSIAISGQTYAYAGGGATGLTTTGETTYAQWYEYMGDISCSQFIIGEKVESIANTPFYPFGIIGITSGLSNVPIAFGYAYAGVSYGTKYPITGCKMQSICCLSSISPEVDNYAFTPSVQTFECVRYGWQVFLNETFNLGPQRTIPLHCPIGSDYSAWSGEWSNIIYDLDI